ncbi:cation:proton antiporter [Kitasatospora sp. NBC_00085]|uniref:cation:proton antiporter n=1 Tax=unclassified Kitasatospora TaxID=2633591 RepID=UPI003244BEA1
MTASLPTPAIPAHQLLVFLAQLGVLLLFALLLGRLAVKIGMPAVVGELCTGVLFGPSVLDRIAPSVSEWLLPKAPTQFHLLDAVGQVGVLLLVGMTGIEMDLKLIRRRRSTALGVGIAGLVLPLGLGVAAGCLVPDSLMPGTTNRAVFAMFLGVALCVSALPVIAKTFADMNLIHRNIGQLTLAAGMVDDLVGWTLLSVVSAMATSSVTVGTVASSVGCALLVVLAAVTLGAPTVRWATSRAERSPEAGPSIATVTVVIVLSAAATQALGLEAALGAFIAGVLIGTSGRVDLARLAPLRSIVMAVFAPLFFATAGLRIDLTVLRHPAVLAAAVAVLLVAVLGKFSGAFLGGMIGRLDRWEALALGAGMNARGVIQIVVATAGLRLGVLNTSSFTIIILVAIVTSVMAPPILRFAMQRVEHTADEELRRRDYAAFTGSSESLHGTHPPV